MEAPKRLNHFHYPFWKTPRFYLALLALLLPALLLWQISEWRMPYRLVERDTHPTDNNFLLYHDFDHDGVSEIIVKQYDPGTKYYSLKINTDVVTIIQQINFIDSLRANWLFFGDYTLDGYDELIAFTINEDSLFLSIVDMHSEDRTLRRHLLLTAEHLSPTGQWDISTIKALLVKSPQGHPENLLFFVDTERALYPRSVYLFNIPSHQILHEFKTDASLTDMFLWDLSGDSREEIVVFTNAPGTISNPRTPYSDDRCWLFVFDQKLKPVFEPLAFGEFPMGMNCYPAIYNDQPALLACLTYTGSKAMNSEIFYINSSGKRIPGWQLPGVIDYGVFIHPYDQSLFFITQTINSSERTEINSKIMHLGADLKLIDEKVLHTNPSALFLIDLNNDRKVEMGIIDPQYSRFSVLNENLTEIASFPFEYPYSLIPVTFKKNKQEPLVIGLNGKDAFHGLSLQPNPFYYWLPVFYLIVAGLLFLMFDVGAKAINNQIVYRRIFKTRSTFSKGGAILIDNRGKIHGVSEHFPAYLQISQRDKKQSVTEKFNSHPALSDFILRQIHNNQPSKTTLPVNVNGHPEQLVVAVQPLEGRRLFLVEIADVADEGMSERLSIWSKAAQKIAHDIKTPLSGLALNLKALQMRVERMSNGQKSGMIDDIEMMRGELEQIRKLTREFLQFVDLEKPHFHAAALDDIVNRSLKKFAGFTNAQLVIETNLEPDLPLLWADPNLLQSVLQILIENALDALAGEGVIAISAGLAQYLEHGNQRFVEIEVADNGPGVAETLRNYLFEPYATDKSGGTGIGLTNAKKIVESHGGNIGLYSREGFVTVFRFSIPVYGENEKDESAAGAV